LATIGIVSRGRNKARALGAASMTCNTVLAMGGDWFFDETNPTKLAPGDAPTTETDPNKLKPGALQVSLAKFIALPEYGPGACQLFSNAQVGPDDPTNYDILDKFVADNADPKNAGRLLTPHADELRRKFVPAVDKKGPVLDRFGSQLRTEKRLKITNNTFKRGESLVFPTINFERDQQGAAHIGFTLRVRNGKAQFFDTGGLNAEDSAQVRRSAGITIFPAVGGMHDGTMDDLLAATCKSLAAPFRGVGVFGRLQPDTQSGAATDSDAKNLLDHVETVLKRARPIGLARLYLLQPGSLNSQTPLSPASVIFASPMKVMHNTSATADTDANAAVAASHNYPISRYLWSLRGLPASGQVQALWVIYGPKHPLSQSLVSAPRTQTLAATLGLVPAAPAPAESALLKQTKILRGCLCNPDGTVVLLGADRLAAISRLEGRGQGIPANPPVPLLSVTGAAPSGAPAYLASP
jgi:hypothetical protein